MIFVSKILFLQHINNKFNPFNFKEKKVLSIYSISFFFKTHLYEENNTYNQIKILKNYH